MLELYGRLVGKMERVHLLRRMFSQQLTNNTTLHFGQVPVLLYIREHDRCTQVDLAEALHVTPASIATSTKRLQKAGYLTKTVNENNLRCTRSPLMPLTGLLFPVSVMRSWTRWRRIWTVLPGTWPSRSVKSCLRTISLLCRRC